MSTDKRQFTLRLQESNYEKLKVIAKMNKRSIAMQMEFFLDQDIENYEKLNGAINVDKSVNINNSGINNLTINS
ncbi:MAG: hypothetical protein IJ728_11180 [Selenomonadaceae bacterium]|nr:hypothetical protein [Selenomonadaceae bacterium]